MDKDQRESGEYQIVEIKAKCNDHTRIRQILQNEKAIFLGKDHQVDTYFKVNAGRLKLREGNIENALIYYIRPDQETPKTSSVKLYQPQPESNLKHLLVAALGLHSIVDKNREIYFIDNIKFHLDEVVGLGKFVEIEAIGKSGSKNPEELRNQCIKFVSLFEIQHEDLISNSYSDMLLAAM